MPSPRKEKLALMNHDGLNSSANSFNLPKPPSRGLVGTPTKHGSKGTTNNNSATALQNIGFTSDKENLTPVSNTFAKTMDSNKPKDVSSDASKRLNVLSPKFENGIYQPTPSFETTLRSPQKSSTIKPNTVSNAKSYGGMKENGYVLRVESDQSISRPQGISQFHMQQVSTPSHTSSANETVKEIQTSKSIADITNKDNTKPTISGSSSQQSTGDLINSSTPKVAPTVFPSTASVDDDEDEDEFIDAKEDNNDSSFLAISQSIRKTNIPENKAIERYSFLSIKQIASNQGPSSTQMGKLEGQISSPKPGSYESDDSLDSSPVSRNTFAFASLPAREPLTKKSLSKILSDSPEFSRHNSIAAEADRALRLQASSERSEGLPAEKSEVPPPPSDAPKRESIPTKPIPVVKPTVRSSVIKNIVAQENIGTYSAIKQSTQASQRVSSVNSTKSVTQSSQPTAESVSSSKLPQKVTETPKRQLAEVKAPDSGNSLMSRTAGGVLRFAKQLFFEPSHDKIKTLPEVQPTPAPSSKQDTWSRLMAPTYASTRKNLNTSPVRIPSSEAPSVTAPPSPSPSFGGAKSTVHVLPPSTTSTTKSSNITADAPPSPTKSLHREPFKHTPVPVKSQPPTVKPPSKPVIPASAAKPAANISKAAPKVSTTASAATSITVTTSSQAAVVKGSNVKLTKQQLQPKQQPSSQPKVTLKLPLTGRKDPMAENKGTNTNTSVSGNSASASLNLTSSTSSRGNPVIGPGTSLNPKAQSRPIAPATIKKDIPSTTHPKVPPSSNIQSISKPTIPVSGAADSATSQPRIIQKARFDQDKSKKRTSDQAFTTPMPERSGVLTSGGLKKAKTPGLTKTPSTASTSTLGMVGSQLKKPSHATSGSMMKSTLLQQAKVVASNSIPQVEGVKFSNDKIRFGGQSSTATTPGQTSTKTPSTLRQVTSINSNSKPHGLIFTPQAQQQRQQLMLPETILPEIMSESEDDDDGNILQDWANSPELRSMLIRQQKIDPDQVFGPIAPLHMDEIFKQSRVSRFRPRSSSANWSGQDRLTQQEIERYAQEMGYRKD
ncbi:Sli15p [Sugiyamaella lignohabitans]|uniref:Sli15p n=1 Tax=Sugiyamaella lignohabitans TaxID=796027 RepID=A0A167DDZ0_9ASCO|nr:Sli15p [Sugiyamaella lignohabitans]ANB12806.1 Sli15p [Sugiyamaella lignohabitans]